MGYLIGRQPGSARVGVDIVVRVAKPELILIAKGPVKTSRRDHLLLRSPERVIHEPDRDRDVKDRGSSERPVDIAGGGSAENSKIGSGDPANSVQNGKTQAGWGELKAARGPFKPKRNVFEITKEEHFTRYDRQPETAAQAVLIVAKGIGKATSADRAVDRVEVAVLKVVVNGSMRDVVACAKDGIEFTAPTVTEKGRGLVLKQGKLCGCFVGNIYQRPPAKQIIVVDSVDVEVVCVGPLSGDRGTAGPSDHRAVGCFAQGGQV